MTEKNEQPYLSIHYVDVVLFFTDDKYYVGLFNPPNKTLKPVVIQERENGLPKYLGGWVFLWIYTDYSSLKSNLELAIPSVL